MYSYAKYPVLSNMLCHDVHLNDL
ncbi:hypothetical protein F383_16296 [Gossypium arboreum]|uniref:Uncharacterized protein n=1 Tax=Gossypium arboreum TaxID=29729 RepID=A0A0B0NIE0_GOSAR|nr:hypothetical protein F383_16296 [Gossypium arboreum]